LIGETGDILGHNLYAYTQNNPVMRIDPSGYFWDYAIDGVFILWGIYDLVKDPSWSKAGWLAVDMVFAVIPFIPTLSALRYADEAFEGVSISDDAAKWLAKGNADNIVYYGVKNCENVYTGITKQSLSKRLYQHNYAGKGFDDLIPIADGLTRNQAPVVETYLIDFGSANAMNSYRSISPTRGIYDDAMKWVKDYIMTNGIPL